MTAQAPRRRTPLACRWAEIALIGVILNLVVLIATPFLRPDLNLFDKSRSYSAVGPWGVVQAVAFVAMGVASIALAIALSRIGIPSKWLHLAVATFAISGIATLGLVWYPMGAPGPATPLGDAHQTAGTIGGVAQLVAALAFALAIRDEPAWNRLLLPVWTAFVVAMVGAVLSQISIWWPDFGIPMGATMRLFVVPLVALWGVVALRLRRVCSRG